jgi:hypothetical protein
VSIDFDEELAADIVGDLEGPIIDFWTPGRIAAYLDRINRRMLAFDRRMMRSQAPDKLKGEWRDFFDGWATFAEAHESWTSRLSSGAVEDIERYERELELWRKALERLGQYAGIDLAPARKPREPLTASPWLWLGAAAAVLGAFAIGRAT